MAKDKSGRSKYDILLDGVMSTNEHIMEIKGDVAEIKANDIRMESRFNAIEERTTRIENKFNDYKPIFETINTGKKLFNKKALKVIIFLIVGLIGGISFALSYLKDLF